MAPVRVLLVDDHAVLRGGLRLLLDAEADITVVGEAATAEEALRGLARTAPDVVLLDLLMPGMGGLEGAERIRERLPATRIVVLSMHDSPEDIRRAFLSGADGYVVKTAADEELIRAIRTVGRGGRYLHPSLGAELAGRRENNGPVEALSPREREVLRLLALGHTNQEVAAQLVVSVRTVESHRAHVMGKLSATTRAELVRHALDAGLLASR
jgi:two-component system, NarL family, response regulator NreC